ncbi:RNA polymerase sigma factor [Daejeonella sp.]|uniref:RNA polymerase sigma factor n=1 Tax=Daejeonella sp. TaxID=2805397 RepID=UPI002731DF49|nr:RNA polymerase sigma-70 factor [Daejeonella sp.]
METDFKMLTDNEILQAISSKNQAAFDKLYINYYKKLYIISFKYTRNQELAEEVVHDVFIKIWNHSGNLNITQSLSSYLSKAVINTSLNVLKSQKGLFENQGRYEREMINEIEEEAETLEERLINIERAIQLLPPQCQKVLLMSKYEKRKQQEIADQLNISIKTVKNHLTYAYKKIKEIVGNGGILILILIFIQFLNRTF